ncbi:MAG TPA: hypothetical protein VM051_10090 [Usitatibacter sp.]|nr:hypothetical protein [Usitatibacter sp.]
MNRALLSAIALCFAAVGCDSQKTAEPPKPKAQAVVPMPAEAPKAPAASAGQDAKTMLAGGTKAGAPKAKKPACKNNNNCTVELDVTGTANPDCMIIKSDNRFFVAKGSAEKIKWKIKTAGWDFEPANGIAFADPQFKCAPQGSQYVCDDANKDTKPTDYPYTIALKKGSAKCTVDPMIVNGAADENTDEP